MLGAGLTGAASAGGSADGEVASAADGVGRLYAQHAESVMAVVVALRGGRVGPEDVVQEAFARAQQHWDEVAVMDRPELWVQRVALHYAGDRTVAEVAETLGVAEGTVKAQLHTARRRLAELLRATAEQERQR